MGPAAVPAAIQGGTALLGGIFGRRSAQRATQRGPGEQRALSGATGLAGMLGSQGRQLFQTGLQQTQQAGNFFGQLVSGDRAAIRQAVAPERREITDLFSGAQRRIASESRGGVADLASAQADVRQAGALSEVAPRARTAAATSLANLGTQATRTGVQAGGIGANTFAQLLGPLISGRLGGAQLQRLLGSDIGGFLFDMLSGIKLPGRGGGGRGQNFGRPRMGAAPSGT